MRKNSRLAVGGLAMLAVLGWLGWSVMQSRKSPGVIEMPGVATTPTPPAPEVKVEPVAEAPRPVIAPAATKSERALAEREEPTLPPWLRLHVVHSSGASVANAKLVIGMSGRPGVKSKVIRAQAEADGRYTETKDFRADCTSVRIDVALPDGAAQRTYELKVPDPLPPIWDVGDLAIQVTRLLEVHVVDPDGEPVSDASVVRKKDAPIPLKTDATGIVLVEVSADVTTLSVAAAGFEPATATVPLAGTQQADRDEMRIVLARGASLAILTTPMVAQPSHARFTLTYADTSELRAWRGADKQRLRAWSDSGVSPDGTCHWRNVPAGVALHAELKSLGTLIGSLEIAPLQTGEQREETLMINRRPERFTLRVVDPGGEGVMNARMELGVNLRTRGIDVMSDDQGMAQVLLYEPAVLDIEVSALSGFAPLELHAVYLKPPEHTLRLEYARAVEVEIVDVSGQPYTKEGFTVSWRLNQSSRSGHRIEPGRWKLDGMPSGVVLIEADRKASILHDTSNPIAKLVLGHPGRIYVEFEGPAARAFDTPESRAGANAWSAEWSVRLQSLTDPAYSTRVPITPSVSFLADFNGLAPGRYEVQLEHLSSGEAARWIAEGEPRTVEVGESSKPVRVTLNH